MTETLATSVDPNCSAWIEGFAATHARAPTAAEAWDAGREFARGDTISFAHRPKDPWWKRQMQSTLERIYRRTGSQNPLSDAMLDMRSAERLELQDLVERNLPLFSDVDMAAQTQSSKSSESALPAHMLAPGTWATNGSRLGKIKEAYAPDGSSPSGAYDVVIYDRDGKRVGRDSPALGGPKQFEPCCSADLWRGIKAPKFPLSRHAYLDELVTYTAQPGAVTA